MNSFCEQNFTTLGKNFTNCSSSGPPDQPGVWSWLPIALLLVFSPSLLLNSLLLLVFATHGKLYTAFNVYLINLILSNFLYSLLDGPLELINDAYTVWWLPSASCTVFMYAQFTVSLVQQNTHALIAFNRFWAMASPISYRQNHNMTLALLLSLACWVVAHLFGLPTIFLNASNYPTFLAKSSCTIYTDNNPAAGYWMLAVQIVCCFDAVLVLALFPVAWYQRRKRGKVTSRTSGKVVEISTTEDKRRSQKDGPSHAEKQGRSGKGDSGHGFLLLTVLTISILICSAPAQLVFAVAALDSTIPANVLSVLTFLYNCQAVIDPILFGLAVKDIRDCIFGMIRR